MADSRERWVFISVAARECGLHPQTLRVYEANGLISPSRTAKGTRRYSDRDLARLKRIRELAELGINQVGIGIILDLEQKLERLVSAME